jgi:hypothetical protein
MEFIPRNQLEKGKWYYCEARNFEYGCWNGEKFDYMRFKFGRVFPDTELYYDDHPRYGTVKPFYEVDIAQVPETARIPNL